MKIRLDVFKSTLIILTLILLIHYSIFIFYTPIDYNWPDDIKFRDFKTVIDSYGDNCIYLFCYRTPFHVETQQILDLKIVRKNSNVYSIDSKTYIETEKDINLNIPNFLNDSNLEVIPEIYINNELHELKLYDTSLIPEKDAPIGTYAIGTFNFKKEKHPNLFEIKNLVIKRDITTIDEIQIPLFFNKDRYVESINVPQIFPIFIKDQGKSKEIIYNVEVPEFYRIEKKTSGFQNISFAARSIDLGTIGVPGLKVNIGDFSTIRTGTIKQFVDEESKEDIVTFTAFISLDNASNSFEVNFIPSKLFLFFILFIILTPLFIEVQNIYTKKIHFKYGFILASYSIILTFLGGYSLFHWDQLYKFFVKFLHFTSLPFLIVLFLFPFIYFIITNFKLKRRISLKIIKKLKIIFD